MANKQVNELTELLSLSISGTNLIPVYDTNESGSEKLKKFELRNINQTIYENTTIYVSTSGSDTTGIGTSASPFATPNGALDWLKNKSINSDVAVTITIKDGHYTGLSVIAPSHKDGNKIFITGENYYDISMTSVQSSSGSTGAWSIVINVSDVSNIVTGDYVLITRSANGTYPHLIEGCWEVTNVDSGNTRITITNTTNYSSAPSGAVTADIRVIKTVLSFTSDGIYIDRNASINIGNVVLVGSGSGYGIFCSGSSNCSFKELTHPIGISNFNYNIYNQNHSYIAIPEYSAISNAATDGIVCIQHSDILCNRLSCTGNTRYGCNCTRSSQVNSDYSIFIGNNTGIFASDLGSVSANYAISRFNTDVSIYAIHNSSINSYGAILSHGTTGVASVRFSSVFVENGTVTNFTGTGIYAAAYAYTYSGSASLSGNVTDYSPSANTQGNEYAYNDN